MMDKEPESRNFRGRLFKAEGSNSVQYAPGISRETLGFGRDCLMAKFTIHKGFQIPLHKHFHEQVSFVLKGKSMVRIGDQTIIVQQGDTFVVPPNTPHAQLALEGTTTIDAWNPVRHEFADAKFQSIGSPGAKPKRAPLKATRRPR